MSNNILDILIIKSSKMHQNLVGGKISWDVFTFLMTAETVKRQVFISTPLTVLVMIIEFFCPENWCYTSGVVGKKNKNKNDTYLPTTPF